jgi:chemotaxis protein methyltransferase CheR
LAHEKEFAFTDNDFDFIVKKVGEETGIVLASHKRDMVYGRLARRLRELKFSTFKEYCDYIESSTGSHEIGNFVNAITTNLTSFFRENHHFEHLKTELAKLNKTPPPNKKLRIWSAASSSGPEPYSIAMTMCEAITNISSWDAKILATDIDTNMLEKCKAGKYEERILENIPESYQKKYVDRDAKSPGYGTMDDRLKKMITFNHLNLLESWPMKGKFDFVFCRNVVIYFDKETQKVLFDRMADVMNPNAILYIGHSENLFKICDRFELIGRTIYKKIS